MANERNKLGQYIRDNVIPSNMSVTDAAKRLGVSRSALSGLLNGKTSLSREILVRLEKAFGANREVLIEFQSKRDTDLHREEKQEIGVRGYVPSFLSIKAQRIEYWASTESARSHLPVLLRKLIHGTGRNLEYVDFPGHDNSQRPGRDGKVTAGTATAWIPQGESLWEFSTSARPEHKADKDYSKRTRGPRSEREGRTFVFVTPRSWLGKQDWAQEKEAWEDGWKQVRAYDASDLEQWLEESVSVPVWLGEQLPLPIQGVKTLHKCWDDWAEASSPRMTKRIFELAVMANVSYLKNWLSHPPDRPFVVAADSNDEALAFIACLFDDDEISAQWGDIVAVFEQRDTLELLASSSSPFIPIAANNDVQQAMCALYKRMHCIVLCARNAVNTQIDVAPSVLGYQGFYDALLDMGIVEEEIGHWIRESGRSPTILRRRLSRIPAVRRPPWATDSTLARALVPMCLVGAWHATTRADQELLAALAGSKYGQVEENFALFQKLDDTPVWSVGQHHGVTSKIDALFGIAELLTLTDISHFLELVKHVLSEPNPALELPESERWASLREEVRDCSKALRIGMGETLVLLSIYGNDLFKKRLGFDAVATVSGVIRDVLVPLTIERVQSQERELQVYAEAAPDTVLTLIEEDLRKKEPAVLSLFDMGANGPLSNCSHTGLLRALECIAWNSTYVSRVALVLAEVSRMEIVGNWSNTSFNSLAGILRSWRPQTAASLDDRIRVLELVNARFPDVSWRLGIGELAFRHRVSMDNYRPCWRSDASGAGNVVSDNERGAFIARVAELLLSKPDYDASELGDLVEHLEALPKSSRATVWELIEEWASQADERDIAFVRERIRRFVPLCSAHDQCQRRTVDKASEIYEKLSPQDSIIRHAWLFENAWVDHSREELMDASLDLKARNADIDRRRNEAMLEVWTFSGLDGVVKLVEMSKSPSIVGQYAARCVSDVSTMTYVLRACLSIHSIGENKLDDFMRGYIVAATGTSDLGLLLGVAKSVNLKQAERLFRCAPFHEPTWRLMDELDPCVTTGYWKRVLPSDWGFTEKECVEIIDRLLDAGRPRVAFLSTTQQWQKLDTSRLQRLLTNVAFWDTEVGEITDYPPFRDYDVVDALRELGNRPGIRREDMAKLEFAFINLIAHTEYGIPNLERLVTDSPNLFVQTLVICYSRRDGKQDSAEWRVDAQHRTKIGSAAMRMLWSLKRVPGSNPDGRPNLESLLVWIEQTRKLCADAGRTEVGDQHIGMLLSSAPPDKDGTWPSKAVSEALERTASENVAQGFVNGKINSRGVVMRGEGGGQERELASKFDRLAKKQRLLYPFVGGALDKIAGFYEAEGDMWDADSELEKRLNQ